MNHVLTRNGMTLTVSAKGAEVCSLKTGEREWIWCGDPAIWGRHAPLCFPLCGKLKDGYFELDGQRYEMGQHGFARDLEHTLVEQTEDALHFRLESSEDTLNRYPWQFRLDTVHRLTENQLTTACTVTNAGGSPMPFQIGYHFAFAIPEEGTNVVKFQCPEEAVQVLTPGGLTAGTQPRFTGESEVVLHEHIFDDDSICLHGLKSKVLRLEKADGGALEVGTAEFPYVLLWSKPGLPGFMCIEPWHGLPDRVEGDHDLFHRPAVKVLQPGESFTATHALALFP